MNMVRPRSRAAGGPVHPYVVEQRLLDIALTGLTALLPAVTALAITIALPKTSLPMVLLVIAGAVTVVALMICSRLEISVTTSKAALGRRGKGNVHVGRLIKSSVGGKRVAFAIALDTAARRALHRRGKLALWGLFPDHLYIA